MSEVTWIGIVGDLMMNMVAEHSEDVKLFYIELKTFMPSDHGYNWLNWTRGR